MTSHALRRRSLIITAGVAAAALVAAPLAGASAAIVPDPITYSADDATVALEPVGTFETGLFDESGAEIVEAYGDRLFVVNAQAGSVSVLDYSDPTAITQLYAIASVGVANSVAVREDGLGVIAFEAPVKTDPGQLVFFDANATDAASAVLGEVTVGALPDMVTISADGAYAVVANEGEPADDFSTDPEGSVAVVSLPAGLAAPEQSAVRIADFHAFEAGGSKPLAADVRTYGPSPDGDFRVSRNLEPEYVTIVGGTAYVALQEANAIAVVDIAGATVSDIWPLGFKNLGPDGSPIDASDRDGAIALRTFPGLFGIYEPDGVDSYTANGSTYLVTANEGDAREWGDYSELSRVKDLEDDGAGPLCANVLADLTGDADLGRLNVTTELGFDETAGCYDTLYTLGGRSFSIWTTDGTQVFDSGSSFEQIIREAVPDFFNSNHTTSSFDNRSDDKGPEPEGLTIGTLSGRTYAFIGFERVGGVAVFDITDPAASAFVTYVNNRDFAVSVDDADDPEAVLSAAGDLGPEGLTFIDATDSPTGAPLLAVANEVSGTTTLFSVADLLVPVNTAPPVITGGPDIGRTVTANPGTWTPGAGQDVSTIAFSYQWLRDGQPIAGATSASYRVTFADQGRALSVRVTATQGAASATAESAPVTVRRVSFATVLASPPVTTTSRPVTVTVRVYAPGGAKAEGAVTVQVGGRTVTGTVISGVARIDVGTLPRGFLPIIAAYAGSGTVSPTTGIGFVLVR